MPASKLSPIARRVVARLRSLDGTARTYPLQTALSIPASAFEVALGELVGSAA